MLIGWSLGLLTVPSCPVVEKGTLVCEAGRSISVKVGFIRRLKSVCIFLEMLVMLSGFGLASNPLRTRWSFVYQNQYKTKFKG